MTQKPVWWIWPSASLHHPCLMLHILIIKKVIRTGFRLGLGLELAGMVRVRSWVVFMSVKILTKVEVHGCVSTHVRSL